MFKRLITLALAAGSVAILSSAATGTNIPDAKVDQQKPAAPTKQTAVVAGGCFWGVEAVFDHVKGVSKVVSGYTGGEKKTANYDEVSTGQTGHAESVQITYDPAVITYGQLLKVYFSVAHDPTEVNRQGPDTGAQYRSAIFYADDEQKKIADAYIGQLNDAKVFSKPIATKVVPLRGFYAAESYHQKYLESHKNNPYIVYNDLPKLAALKKELPQLCKR